jgi:hypothetical protein
VIDTRLLFNRSVVLETAPDGVAEAGRAYPVPARYVRGFVNSGVASVAPDEAPLPPKTAVTNKDLTPPAKDEGKKKEGSDE